MTYRLRNIVLAVGLAALAAILTAFYTANVRESARKGAENVKVFVAVKEIPVGTSGSAAFERGLIKSDEVARRSVVPGAVAERSQIEELVATETIYEGEQVSVRRFKPAEAAGIRAELKGNLRAIEVPGSSDQLMTGTVKKGDRVDVVATWAVPEGATHHVSRVILRDLLVLRAADASLASERVANSNGSVQLLVTDSQASKLAWIVENGKWRLQLRAPVEAQDSAENVEDYQTLLVDGVSRGQLERLGQVTEGSDE